MDLTVPESSDLWLSWWRTWHQAGKQDTGAVAERLDLINKDEGGTHMHMHTKREKQRQRQRDRADANMGFRPSKLTSSGIPPPKWLNISPKVPPITMDQTFKYEPIEVLLRQTSIVY